MQQQLNQQMQQMKDVDMKKWDEEMKKLGEEMKELGPKMEKEMQKRYFEEVEKREGEFKAVKAAKEEEKNKIFEKLSADAEKAQAEKDYWENVRNELYIEEGDKRERIKEVQEKEKKQNKKRSMVWPYTGRNR